MTLAPEAKRLAFADLDQAAAALRARGLRLSTPRRMVLEALFEAQDPVAAEWIAQTLEIELTSVYRNLEALERNGIVRHVHLGHSPGLYTLVGKGEQEYLYCERCGKARALEPAQLDPVRDQIRERFGHEARFTHFPIMGTCEPCGQAESRHGPPLQPQTATALARHNHP